MEDWHIDIFFYQQLLFEQTVKKFLKHDFPPLINYTLFHKSIKILIGEINAENLLESKYTEKQLVR